MRSHESQPGPIARAAGADVEHPILFSGPMVLAILEDRKTQTRRIVDTAKAAHRGEQPTAQSIADRVRCPYGASGDRLWVRESWAHGTVPGQVFYMADRLPGHANTLKWKPSIHMPRAASRISLEVVSVRAERLRDITIADILAEGIKVPDVDYSVVEDPRVLEHERDIFAREAWAAAWNTINGKRASWSEDPWVWRVEFRRVGQGANR